MSDEQKAAASAAANPEPSEDPAQMYEQYVLARAATIWAYEDTGFDLNLEEQLFVRSFIIDRNPVAAMRRLGHHADSPAILKRRADKMLAKPPVIDAIDLLATKLMAKLEVTAEAVQRRIAAAAFFDPREVMTFDQFGVQLLNSRFWTKEQAAAISSIKMGQNGIEIKFYDGLRAAEMLAKQLGVQPEDDLAARAEEARAGAAQAIHDIMTVFRRTVQDKSNPPAALPAPDQTPETTH